MTKLFSTFLLLLGLLALTVLASQYISGTASLAISLLIAFAKAACVTFVFMELASGITLSRVVAAAAIVWIIFFYTLAATDVLTRPVMAGSVWK